MVNTCGEAIAAVKFTRNVSVVILKSNRINSGYSKNLTDKLINNYNEPGFRCFVAEQNMYETHGIAS